MCPSKPLLLLLLSLTLTLIQPSSSSSSTIRMPTDPAPCPLAAKPPSCPVSCFRPDPVCGEDGTTYWCGCAEAACKGVRVAKVGFCEVGNGGSGQALLLVHIVWLIVLGFSLCFGLL